MSDRRARAVATLERLGVDPTALEAGSVDVAALRPLLGRDGETLVDALGDVPHARVATLLAALEAEPAAKPLRRAIRRALYRLAQQGVARPAPPPVERRVPLAAADVEALVSHVDGRGDRIAWLVRPLPAGGNLLVAAQLNEPEGLRDLQVVEVGRKQIKTTRQELERQAGMRLVPVDWRTADALVVEAHERSGGGPGRDYLRVRGRITSDPPRQPAEPVSAHARRPDAAEAAALALESGRLVEEPEFRGWGADPERAAPFATELEEMRRSPLVLSPLQQQERVREVFARAATALWPSTVLARRLEGTAYVLAETGRAAVARIALAVAVRIGERPGDAADVPLVATLVQASVGSLVVESEKERESSLVLTPAEALRARSSSRPGRTRA